MSTASLLDPFTDLLRSTPRGAAAVLATTARTRLTEAETLTAEFLNTILLTLIVPAEALARRAILALAAALPTSVWNRQRGAAQKQTAPPPARPQQPSAQSLTPVFRMLEPLLHTARRAKSTVVRTHTKRAAAPQPIDGERLLRTVFRRMNAVIKALGNPDGEAVRFLRRRRAAVPERRPPLAFGHPPGLKAAAADPVLTACLTRRDDDAKAAWEKLRDTS